MSGTEKYADAEWSPDGRQLAAIDIEACCNVYVFRPDGTGRRKLSFDTSSAIAWSPSGEELAFFDEDDLAIHIIGLNGSGERRLVQGNEPDWSSQGEIAFQWRADGGRLRIFVIDADGKGERQLTSGGGTIGDTSPVWSPDGRRIAFVSDRDGDAEIEIMNADGSGRRQLTHNDVYDSYPTWSPEGDMIAFARVEPGLILVMDADGGGERTLAQGSLLVGLAWQPAPR